MSGKGHPAVGAISSEARLLLDALAQKHRLTLRLPEDASLLAGISKDSNRLVERMAKRGLLFRLGRGRYIVGHIGATSPLEVASPCLMASTVVGARPHFFSYLTGMVFHELTDTHSLHIYLAVRQSDTRRSHIHLPGGHDAQIVRLNDRYWPELTRSSDDVQRVRAASDSMEFYWMASPERTLLDALNRPELSGGLAEVSHAWGRAIRRGIDEERLVRIANRLGTAASRRAILMLELAGRTDAADTLRSVTPIRSGNVLLTKPSYSNTEQLIREPRSGVQVTTRVSELRAWLTSGLES